MACFARTGAALQLLIASLAVACGAQAAVSPEQADALGKELTPFGAEKGGNADGSIPAYTGGLPALGATGRQGEFVGEDPFAGEKPRYTITAANLEQHAAQLTAGTQELLRRHPGTFRVDVYPTHRTAAYPQWVLDNTRRNATGARTSDGGLGIHDALPGVPFPIPADGNQAMWNHRLRYSGRAVTVQFQSWLQDAAGQSTQVGEALARWEFPGYDDARRQKTINQDETLFLWRADFTGPQRRAGESMMMAEVLNPLKQPRRMWSYVPGQRRVRMVNYPDDAASGHASGLYIVDDAFIFNGSLERFDVKLLGKREMIVPYNSYRLLLHSKPTEMLRPGHVNPDLLRWELHRVWVVEATLRTGQHHPYSRRVFYLDEDTWAAIASDGYGADGKLLRAVFSYPIFGLETGVPFFCTFTPYSFDTNGYFVSYFPASSNAIRFVRPLPESDWSPDAMAGSGVR